MYTELLIEGQYVSAQEGRTFRRADPVTGATASEAAAASVNDALKAVAAAHAAFPAWAKLGPGAHRSILMRAADVMASKSAEFVEIGIAETGATGSWNG